MLQGFQVKLKMRIDHGIWQDEIVDVKDRTIYQSAPGKRLFIMAKEIIRIVKKSKNLEL